MKSTFPVNYAVLAPDALATDILPGFDVGSISECAFYSGGFNDTYRVKNDGGKIYYLRAYRRSWRTLADIQFELDVLEHLQQKEFPAPRPVPYRDGKLYCEVPAPEGTRYLALFTEAPSSRQSHHITGHPNEIMAFDGGRELPKTARQSSLTEIEQGFRIALDRLLQGQDLADSRIVVLVVRR